MMATTQARRRSDTPRMILSRAGVVSLLSAADRLRKRFSELTEAHGITFQQYNVLRILRGAGGEGLPTMEVRKRMIEQAPGITGLIDRLEAKKWVVRVPAAKDRREILCAITPEGLALLKRLDPQMDDADLGVFLSLPQTRLRDLIEALELVHTQV